CHLLRHIGCFVSRAFWAGSTGYVEPEAAAHAGLATHTDLAIHQRGQFATQHQPDTSTGDVRAFTPQTLEWLEQLRQLLARQARPGIVDPQPNAVGTHLVAHANRAARTVVLDRVG